MPFPEITYPQDIQLNVPVRFRPTVNPQLLEQTKQKLALARFPEEQEGFGPEDWRQGSKVEKVKKLVNFWQTKYDWKTQEVRRLFLLRCTHGADVEAGRNQYRL
jgi:hypothetical protein